MPQNLLQNIGAAGFGALIGWLVYYINRYRKGDVQFSDLTTLVGVIGGGAITGLFGKGDKELFGAYGIGLFLGFFAYFLTLIALVRATKGVFGWAWFLDGRRRRPAPDEEIQGDTRQTVSPMAAKPLGERVATLEEQIKQYQERISSGVRVQSQAPIVDATLKGIVPAAAKIIAACESVWDANKNDCSAFVISVAQKLGIAGLEPPADKIVSDINTATGWRVLDDGIAAKEAAERGEFVIGGLRGADHSPPRQHGHVVVVVAGPLHDDKYPTAYWGSLGGTPYKNTPINWAWRESDRGRVRYSARSL